MYASKSNSPMVFNVRRSEPELVRPARPTPNELKPLSDIDGQDADQYQHSFIMFYPANQGMKDKDPSKVIKKALAEVLVYYYPWAGRFRESSGRKLSVDCTAEGVVFVEADADVRLDEFGEDSMQPPFPFIEKLLYNKSSNVFNVIDSPLLTLQVTRLLCGGFIFAFSFNHSMTDGIGLLQFITAVTELARGSHAPTILPVWKREILYARVPPRITCTHHEFEDIEAVDDDNAQLVSPDLSSMVYRSIFIGKRELDALRRHVPPHLQHSSTGFEILAACVWKCRTIALQFKDDKKLRLLIPVDARKKFSPSIPEGYHGAVYCVPAAIGSAGEVARGSLGFPIEAIKKAKESVSEEYMRSFADLNVLRSRPGYGMVGDCFVTDHKNLGFLGLDFGWGKPVYSGSVDNGPDPFHGIIFTEFRDGKEGVGRMVQVCMPVDVMDRFGKAFDGLLKSDENSLI